MTNEALALAVKAREALLAKKGENPVLLDVRGLSSITDYYLIVTGLNTPHLKALLEDLEREFEQAGRRCARRSGKPESGWMVADYLDVVIHIFSAQHRGYYALEELWSDATRVA
ncbi:MAG: ribosome silencing factor [Kiritimatiellaeota bacterium]|nr:ribosome silencing factor [Kiritimatiellota bacterium]